MTRAGADGLAGWACVPEFDDVVELDVEDAVFGLVPEPAADAEPDEPTDAGGACGHGMTSLLGAPVGAQG